MQELRDVCFAPGSVVALESSYLTEYQGDPSYKGFVLRGVFGRAGDKNKNNRVYTEKLWRKVTESQETKNRLSNGQILGELRHPDYTEPAMKEAAIKITSLTFDPATRDVIGEAIPTVGTPNGDILVALLKLGVRPAVSSRGVGDVTNRNGVDYVVEDTYNYITHDLTLDPSVTTAWPKVYYKESWDSFEKEVASILEKYSGKLSEHDKDTYRALTESVKKHSNLTEAMAEFCACQFPSSEGKTTSAPIIEQGGSPSQPTKEKTMGEENKARELVEQITILTTEKLTLSQKLAEATNQNTELQKKVAQLESVNTNYNKTVGLVEEMTNRLNTEKKNSANLKTQLEKTNRNFEKALGVIKETSRRFKVLKDSHDEILSGRYPALYEKALSIIKEIRKRYLTLKNEADQNRKKLDASTKVALAIQNKVRTEKVETYLESELKALGGKERFAKLLENVNTPEDAQARVEALKEMQKSSNRGSFVPNFGGKPVVTLTEEKKEDKEPKVIDHPFYTQKRSTVAQLVERVS